jgi:hypothetical protein
VRPFCPQFSSLTELDNPFRGKLVGIGVDHWMMVAMIVANYHIRCRLQRLLDSAFDCLRGSNLNRVWQQSVSPVSQRNPGIDNYFALLGLNYTGEAANP